MPEDFDLELGSLWVVTNGNNIGFYDLNHKQHVLYANHVFVIVGKNENDLRFSQHKVLYRGMVGHIYGIITDKRISEYQRQIT